MRQANTQLADVISWAGEDDAPLREAVRLAEREKSWATYDRAKGLARGSRGLLIIQWYAHQDPLQHIIRQRLKGGGHSGGDKRRWRVARYN